MLENVCQAMEPATLKVITAPFHRLGYKMRWTLVPAYAVGLPHKRMRWFCACYLSLPLLRRVAGGMTPHHRKEPPRCVAERGKEVNFHRRFISLGYTVIPACIVVAFKHLAAGGSDGFSAYPIPTPPNIGLVIRQGDLVVRKPMWPTPRTTPSSSKRLSQRNSKDLPTTVRWEVESTSQHMSINWAEWLMNYPKDWTATS